MWQTARWVLPSIRNLFLLWVGHSSNSLQRQCILELRGGTEARVLPSTKDRKKRPIMRLLCCQLASQSAQLSHNPAVVDITVWLTVRLVSGGQLARPLRHSVQHEIRHHGSGERGKFQRPRRCQEYRREHPCCCELPPLGRGSGRPITCNQSDDVCKARCSR